MDISSQVKKYEKLTYDNSISYEYISAGLDIVGKYIKDNNLILYGGMAIDMALKLKGHPGIYDTNVIPDYDCYTNDSIEVSNSVGKLLDKANLPIVSVINALHATTRKVRVRFENVMDVTYTPDIYFEHIPTMQYSGFTFVHPYYQMIDMHRAIIYIFEDPPLEPIHHRIIKDMTRYKLLLDNYPIKVTDVGTKMNTIPIFKFDRNDLLAGTPIYALYYSYIAAMNTDMSGIIPMVYANGSISYPSEFKDIMIYNTITDDYTKYVSDTSTYHAPIKNLFPRHIKNGDHIIYDNLGHKLASGSLFSVPIPNIQYFLMFCMFKYHADGNQLYLNLYDSATKLVAIAASLYDSMNKKLQAEFRLMPFFLNHITYGSQNISTTYINMERYRRAFINQDITQANKQPDHFYPTQATSWDKFDYSLFKIDGTAIIFNECGK